MASDFLDGTEYNSLVEVLKEETIDQLPSYSGLSLAQILAARGILSLALAALAFPEELDEALHSFLRACGDERTIIYPEPGSEGTLLFDVKSARVGRAYVEIRPDDFDVKSPQQLAEFKAYRNLVDLMRGLPATGDKEEPTKVVGHFYYFREEQDSPEWDALWEFWQHAHGM